MAVYAYITAFGDNALTIIDITDPEALLVRQNADAKDIFSVDTTNSQIYINGSLGINTLNPSEALTVQGGNIEVFDENDLASESLLQGDLVGFGN